MSNSAILNLPPLKWRGVPVYCSQIETSFTQRQVERAYPYVAIPGHDWTGFGGMRISATIHFLNTIERGAYPDKWVEFRSGIWDGSIGPLEHPDLGEITARVLEGSMRITAQSTAGIAVTVTWVQSREEVEEQLLFSTPGGQPEESAEAADEALAELDLEYPDGEPDTTLGDSIGAIEGGVFSLGQEIGGAINKVKGDIAKHLDALDRIGQLYRTADPSTRDAKAGASSRTIAENALMQLYAGLGKRADDTAKKARPVSVFMVKSATPLAALAGALGNSVDDLITLNSSVAASPTVNAGSKIVHYVKA